VGVIGTRATIRSGTYEAALRQREPDVRIFSRACPLFVPLVEEGWQDKRITSLVVQEYLSEMVREEIDSIILGCTHYPLLKQAITAEYPDLNLIDSSEEIARAVGELLTRENLRNDRAQGTPGSVRIFLTDVTDQMQRLEQLFYGMHIDSLEEIALEEG
jgi:glutamate racemase